MLSDKTNVERFPVERAEILKWSKIEDGEYIYWEYLTLRNLVCSELKLAGLPSCVFNMDGDVGLTVDEIVGKVRFKNAQIALVGETGVGKSTLLLRMLSYFANVAQIDETSPIPVFINLGMWMQERASIVGWIENALPVKKVVVMNWLQNCKLFVLLDGLDEVPSEYRSRCVQMINAFMKEYPEISLIISGTPDLSEWSSLELETQMHLEPMAIEQVDTYLEALGNGVGGLHLAIRHDTNLQEIATSPLNLNLMMIAFHDKNAEGIGQQNLRTFNHIMAAFIDKRLQIKEVNEYPYSREDTLHYLGWMGRQMQKRDITSVNFFYAVDVSWLSTPDLVKQFFRRWRWIWTLPVILIVSTTLFAIFKLELSQLLILPSIAYPVLMAFAAYDAWYKSSLLADLEDHSIPLYSDKMRYFLRYLLLVFLVGMIIGVNSELQRGGNLVSTRPLQLGALLSVIYVIPESMFLIGNRKNNFTLVQHMGGKRVETLLVQEGSIPDDSITFVDFLVDHLKLMTYIGGTSQFTHPRFRDYFATQYKNNQLQKKMT